MPIAAARRFGLEIFVISFAGLLLEISYTRLVSFKLFYYYTYLVIGFALLGVGSGGVLVSIAPRLGRAAPERMLGAAALAAAAAVGAGYAVVALQPTDTGRLWQEPFREGAKLLVHSISITLMALLVSTGIGSLATTRYGEGSRWAPAALFAAIAVLTVFYQHGLSPLTAALLGAPLGVRGAVAFFVLVPLGLALGAFMPLGLAAVAASTPHREVYVAWGWAVNGFFSVIGSVLTTALSMSYGFRVVLFLGLAAYAVAALLSGGMRRLTAPTPPI